jgi:glycosyltransferase involved in cell wall biosynthesis
LRVIRQTITCKPGKAIAMNNPLVSVCMVTYNHENYIAQAIEGVLQQQTTFPIELVVGEDCSTDRTREIVLKYQKKYPSIIRVITSERNVGARKNVYRTGKACRGKYIAICEGDDYWHVPHKLQKQLDYMESHPECGLILADCDEYHQESGKLKRNRNYANGFRTPVNLRMEDILMNIGAAKYTCTSFMRSNLYNRIVDADPYLYQDHALLMSDTQTWTELAAYSTVTYIPETYGTHRVLEESGSRSRNEIQRLRFLQSVNEMRMYICKKHNLSAAMLRKAQSDWCEMSLDLAIYERNPALVTRVRTVMPQLTRKQRLKCMVASNRVAYFFYYIYYALLVKTGLYGSNQYCTFDCPLNLSLDCDMNSQSSEK